MFEVGFAQADITPQVGTALSGFIFRENQPSKGVDDPLFVRVLAIRHKGQINLLSSFELLGIGNELHRLILAELKQTLGDQFHMERYVLTATHSHSSPPTVAYIGVKESFDLGLAQNRIIAFHLRDVSASGVGPCMS